MKSAPDGLPVVGKQSKELGVRVPPNEHADVDLEQDGQVVLNRRGMSVAAHWRFLKPHLVPRRLKDHVYGASGPNSLAIYRYGDGEFVESDLNEYLALALKRGSMEQANVVPARAMSLDDFVMHLVGMREHWIPEELL